jgi:hypothetical protein
MTDKTTDEPPPGFGGKPGDPLYIPPRKLWRHKKRGTTYEEIGRGELQMASDVVDGSEMVIYRGEDGRLWVREVSEFEDGRFEKVQP